MGEETGGIYNGFDKDVDSVQVNSPGKETSVAEAKPVGLAIAGVGGVASSKPSATAVVGPGTLTSEVVNRWNNPFYCYCPQEVSPSPVHLRSL